MRTRQELIGEVMPLDRKIWIPLRLFSSMEEGSAWLKATAQSRCRWVRKGSAAWIAALDEEIRIAQEP